MVEVCIKVDVEIVATVREEDDYVIFHGIAFTPGKPGGYVLDDCWDMEMDKLLRRKFRKQLVDAAKVERARPFEIPI